MSDIFLSYASQDRDKIRPLVKLFEDVGWSVFWDRNIPVGKTWHQVIEKEISDAKVVVVVWTTNSIVSDWVHEEADEGKRRNILFPITFDNIKPPLGFGRIQAANLSSVQVLSDSEVMDQVLTDLALCIVKSNESQSGGSSKNKHNSYKKYVSTKSTKKSYIENISSGWIVFILVVVWGVFNNLQYMVTLTHPIDVYLAGILELTIQRADIPVFEDASWLFLYVLIPTASSIWLILRWSGVKPRFTYVLLGAIVFVGVYTAWAMVLLIIENVTGGFLYKVFFLLFAGVAFGFIVGLSTYYVLKLSGVNIVFTRIPKFMFTWLICFPVIMVFLFIYQNLADFEYGAYSNAPFFMQLMHLLVILPGFIALVFDLQKRRRLFKH